MKRSVLRYLAATTGLIPVLSTVPATAQTWIEDGEMALADWRASTRESEGGFTAVAAHAETGGNPGAYRTLLLSSTDGLARGRVDHLHRKVWVPSVQGSIGSLEVELDVACFDVGTSDSIGFVFIVEQQGSPYFGPYFIPTPGAGWQRLQFSDLSARSFEDANPGRSPDFSVAGSTIAFGFMVAADSIDNSPLMASCGADNFFVRVDDSEVEDAGVLADAGRPTDAAPPDDLGASSDAGTNDASSRSDLGANSDADAGVDVDSGCSCATARPSDPTEGIGLLSLALSLWVLGPRATMRRRRRTYSVR